LTRTIRSVTRRALIALFISLVSLATLVGAARWIFLKAFVLDVQLSPAQSEAAAADLERSLRMIDQQAKAKHYLGRREDLSSVGLKDKEDQLLEFRHWVEVFQLTSGQAPEKSSDLQNLTSIETLSPRQKKEIGRLAQRCFIKQIQGESYLLNCDGWRPQQAGDEDRLVSGLDSDTERFYILNDHLFVYAPPIERASSANPE
jgi:hypothetical protein